MSEFKKGDVIVRIGSFDRYRVVNVDDMWYYTDKFVMGKMDGTYFIEVSVANSDYVKVGYDLCGLAEEGQDGI